MDETLKNGFDALCKEFGMSMSVAINVFAKAVVREKRIPFEISSSKRTISNEAALEAFNSLREQAKQNDLSDMTLEDINKEITLARQEKKND